ncbi:hypothetical protein RDMS_05560 [Deinococcus sp. RL]|uniref:hypothetical protein n=1 Tax=Deinococcus sp. RL TaxID=1489678 RepID=UPI0004D97147|nr:hypothetical protein [Deinococcus sp. RL]KEF34688.1 hypothetical protein RDMS_05560 [Deinococcus sp. RL]
MVVAFVNPAGLLTRPQPDDPEDAASAALANLLGAGAELIPVTGRDEEELLEVPAPFTSWQILRHGAVVLTPEGEEDPAWRRLTRETLREREAALRLAHQAAQHIGMLLHLGTEAELQERGGLPLRVTLRHPQGVAPALAAAAREWRAWLAESPFAGELRLLEDPAELVLLPCEITPESAVNYVLEQLPAEVSLRLGISAVPSDAPFLALCDYAVVPGRGALLRAALEAAEAPGEGEAPAW